MNEQVFQNKFADLISQINDLPEDQQAALHTLAKETNSRHHAMGKSFNQIRSGLDNIRLNMKYAQFDLEATRRERDEYRDANLDQEFDCN